MDRYPFSKDAAECKLFWDVRKGLIPIVGGAREAGTSMLIEDVACPVVQPLSTLPPGWPVALLLMHTMVGLSR